MPEAKATKLVPLKSGPKASGQCKVTFQLQSVLKSQKDARGLQTQYHIMPCSLYPEFPGVCLSLHKSIDLSLSICFTCHFSTCRHPPSFCCLNAAAREICGSVCKGLVVRLSSFSCLKPFEVRTQLR